MKALIPNRLKYPFWYIFKSPQRALSRNSLKNEIKGIAIYLSRCLLKKQELKVSICIGISNRTEMFLNNCLPSLNRITNVENIELSIFDMGSTDYDFLKDKIKKNWKGSLKISSVNEKFSRAKAFNNAVEQSSGELIFICDADMSVPENIISIANKVIRNKTVWFPICKALPPDGDLKKAEWLNWSAKGNLLCKKSDFYSVGKLNEKYTEWGKEDIELWEQFYKNDFIVIRQKLNNFHHNYHAPVEGAFDRFKN